MGHSPYQNPSAVQCVSPSPNSQHLAEMNIRISSIQLDSDNGGQKSLGFAFFFFFFRQSSEVKSVEVWSVTTLKGAVLRNEKTGIPFPEFQVLGDL